MSLKGPIWHIREQLLRFLHRRFFTILSSITFGEWIKLLDKNDFAVDFGYWPRACAITFGSFLNSYLAWQERKAFGSLLPGVRILPPLFILGHWRTGTTHLHNLLALDPNFAFPNNCQVAYPKTFLMTEGQIAPWMDRWLPQHRLQDNMRLRVDMAQEDEFALFTATSLSPYTAWVFPRNERHYERYLTFRDVSAQELECWKRALMEFLKKLTWKYHKPLLLKSPPHTGRIKLLLQMFPQARFVHIHRDPYRVFQSTKHTTLTAGPAFALQRRNLQTLNEGILRRYRILYDAFFEERSLIPPGHYHDVRFEELERDPLGQMESLYEKLGLGGFDSVRPAFQRYVASLADYRKNVLPHLPARLRERITDQWRRSFEEWGYETK
jgi:omega-hydroxy-beta-dihydromenaquinone-9 sulfotransferase